MSTKHFKGVRAIAVDMASFKLDSEVQKLIVKACLEAGGSVALAPLTERAKGLVKYRAAAALSQNAKLLEDKGLVERWTEGRRVFVKLKPAYVEEARRRLGVQAPLCLVSGYTWNPARPGDVEPLRNYVDALEKLKGEGVEVSYVYCFTTPEAAKKRAELGIKPDPDHEEALPFEVYQVGYEELRRRIYEAVDQLVYHYSLLLDITPLTKLFSDVLAEVSERYGLARLYHFGPRITWIKRYGRGLEAA